MSPRWKSSALLLMAIVTLGASTAAAQEGMGSKSTGRRAPRPRAAEAESARKPTASDTPVRKQTVKPRVAKPTAPPAVPTAAPRATPVVLLQDDFSGEQVLPAGKANNGDCTFAYADGAYLIDATAGGVRPCHQALPTALDANVRIEVDVSTVQGAAPATVGLGFGKSRGEFYYFTVDRGGRFLLGRCASECGFVDPLTSPAAGTVLKENGAVNVLAVEIRGPVITMFANGKRLGQHEYEIERDAAGQAVMWVGGGKAAFHALRVLALPK